MTSAALDRSSAPERAQDGLNLYLRAVWARLVFGALLAALAAWTVGMMPFLRASILTEARFIALDLTAIGLFALLIALRTGAFARIREALARPNAKAGATYAAMHLVALAEARAAQPTIHKEATS